jgi:hypothetical protein
LGRGVTDYDASYFVTNAMEEPVASIFMVEDGGNVFLRIAGNRIKVCMA